jgi:HSP20 family protein
MAIETSMSTGSGNGVTKARKPEKMDAKKTVAPAVDIYENGDELLLVTDMPGVDQEGVTVNLEKRELVIEGRRPRSEGEGSPLALESDALDYRRSFLLPQGIDAEKISAELRYGVLRVRVPKAAAVKPRQIQVKAG